MSLCTFLVTEFEKCKEGLKHSYLKRINQKKSTKWPRLGDPTLYVDITIARAAFLPARLNEKHNMGLVGGRDHSYITLDELLKDDYGKTILIEGDPGAGKTTFAFQMCKKWAQSTLLVEDIVFWIPLRHYKSVNTLNELFDKLGYPEMMRYAQQNNGKGLVLILDGWNELPNQLRTSSPFHDIIFGDIRAFKHSTIIVTSRPSCSAEIAEAVEETNSYYRIMGFDYVNAETYIKGYFCDESYTKVFHDFLTNHENLRQPFYNPTSFAIMCFVHRSGGKQVLQTISKFYERFVILHLRSNIPDSFSQDLAKFDTLHDVPEKMKSLFLKFCKIAFDMLIDDKLILHEEELKVLQDDLQLKEFDGFGLLHIDHYTSPLATMEKSYSFIHKVVQEVLAAIFILNTVSIIDDTFENYFYRGSHLQNVFAFVFGLAPKEVLKPLAEKLLQKFKKPDQNIAFLSSVLHCLFEAHDETLCREFGKVFSERKDIHLWTATLFDCLHAGYFIAACGIKRLNVTMHCDYIPSPDYHFEVIAKYLQNASIDIASFRFVKFGEVMSHKGMEQLAKTLSVHHNIHSVELFMIDSDTIHDTDCVTILCDSICKHNLRITYLVLPCTYLSERDFESIGSVLTMCLSLKSLNMFCLPTEHVCLDLSMSFCKALCRTTSLEELVLHPWSLSQADSKVFGNIICKNCSLKELLIQVDTVDCLDPILNGLSSNTSITRFILFLCKISHSDSLGQYLEKCLTSNHSLKILDFNNVLWLPSHLISICIAGTGLCTNTTLVTLGLSGCYIDAEVCQAVCGMLSQNRTLRHLFLNPVHLEKQEAIVLIDSCKCNATLEVLSLVQWPPKNKSHEQGEDPFQYSFSTEINDVLRKIQEHRQDRGEPLLKVYWSVSVFIVLIWYHLILFV